MRREAGAGDINLGVVCVDVYAETVKLDEMMGVGVVREKKGPKGQVLGFPSLENELVLLTTLLTTNMQAFPEPATSSDTLQTPVGHPTTQLNS